MVHWFAPAAVGFDGLLLFILLPFRDHPPKHQPFRIWGVICLRSLAAGCSQSMNPVGLIGLLLSLLTDNAYVILGTDTLLYIAGRTASAVLSDAPLETLSRGSTTRLSFYLFRFGMACQSSLPVIVLILFLRPLLSRSEGVHDDTASRPGFFIITFAYAGAIGYKNFMIVFSENRRITMHNI